MGSFGLRLLGIKRRHKRALQILCDILLIWVALWTAFLVRLGVDDVINPLEEHQWLFICAPIIAIPMFQGFGLYRFVVRHFSTDSLIRVFQATTVSALVLSLLVFFFGQQEEIVPRSVVFNYWWLSLILVAGVRLALRQYLVGDWRIPMSTSGLGRHEKGLVRVAIYGAGVAGNQLVAALRTSKTMLPVAFIDDDSSIAGRSISGLRVYKPRHIKRMIELSNAEEILLAIPSATRSRRKEVLSYLEGYPLHVRSVPSFIELADGRVKVDDIQEVDIADLLGRDAVPAQEELLERCIAGKVIAVTGAGGSIGSELCRQILSLKPTVLILFEHSEFNLYSILSELEQRVYRESLPLKLVPILGSIRNSDHLLDVLTTWKVDTIYHAAAYKHVPMVEHNIAEGILNNVIGTLNTAQAAIKAEVENFVLISTDKAVRPTNVMGSTKRLAEMVLQALSCETSPVLFRDQFRVNQSNKTRFTMVRFGNVLGSSGSVIPLFHKQIKAGGPLTVTHPKITRYFMTIPEAAQLVIQAGSMGLGGDVFVLDMGEPVKIAELAEKMIHLSGLTVRSEKNPHGDIAIEYSGLRPGEKLYEELLIGDNVETTRHAMIMTASEDHLSWIELQKRLELLLSAIDRHDFVGIRKLLRETVVGYTPDGEIVDLVYQQRRHFAEPGADLES